MSNWELLKAVDESLDYDDAVVLAVPNTAHDHKILDPLETVI